MATEILVCVRCRSPGAPADHPREGLALYEAVQIAAFDEEPQLIVRAIDCMSSCNRSCAIALQASRKTTYLFCDLRASEEAAADIVACAKIYQVSADGFMPRESRPQRLREGILARIPVLNQQQP